MPQVQLDNRGPRPRPKSMTDPDQSKAHMACLDLRRSMSQDRASGKYPQLATCTKAIGGHGGSTGATHRCLGIPRRLDPQLGLHTGVRVCSGVWIPNWGYVQAFGIPNRGYIQVFGFPTAATHGCLDPQPRLHTGVWSPKRAIVQVASMLAFSRRLCTSLAIRRSSLWLSHLYT